MQLLRYMCAAKFDTAQRKDTVVVLHYIYCTKQQTLYGICVQIKLRETVRE